MKLSVIKIIKYIQYIIQTLNLNILLKSKVKYSYPFFPLISKSRFRLYKERGINIECKPNAYILLGYGSGGIGSFAYSGINLELYMNSTLRIQGASLVGFGSSICIYDNATIEIGDGVYMASNTVLKSTKLISIGDNCAISWNVTIMDSDFHNWSENENPTEISSPVIIKSNVWIGNNVIILKGVEIGEGSIIGAGSVVTRSVPSRSMVAGNPARVIKTNIKWRK